MLNMEYGILSRQQLHINNMIEFDEKIEVAFQNRQSKDIDNIGHNGKRRTKTNNTHKKHHKEN